MFIFNIFRYFGVAGPGEIINWIGYLGGHTVRRLKAITYIKVLVIKDSVIDHRLANEKQSYQQFQKMASRTQDFMKLEEALKKRHSQKFKMDDNDQLPTCKQQTVHSWDREPCHTLKYLSVVIMHFARMVICCLWMCANKTVERIHSDGHMGRPDENHSHFSMEEQPMKYEIHMDMMDIEEYLRWSLLGLDIVTNSLEFVMLTTQAYYSKHGLLINSYRFTVFFAFKTQLLLWFLTGFPFETLAGRWPYAQCLAANRMLGFWRIYAMKNWIVHCYPSKIKILSILWVVILYFAFLLLFTTAMIMGLEFTCNPKEVVSFMICYVDQIDQYSMSIGDAGFLNQAKTKGKQPYSRSMFMNSSDCWIPGDGHGLEEKSAECQRHYSDMLKRYWTFTRFCPQFGEGRYDDYEGMKNELLIRPYSLLLVAIYYSAQTLTLTGFGEFNAAFSDTQAAFYMMLIICSYILNSYISIQFLAPSIEDSKNDNDHFDRLDLQIQYLKDKKVPEALIHELCHYINCQHINIASVDQFLEAVPDLLLREFKYLSFREMLRKNILFQQESFSHMEIIYLLAAHVHPLYLPQSATLLREGDVADMIYFQAEGEVLTRAGNRISCSGVDQVFGGLEEGLSIWQCTITTLSPCCFLVISKVNILKILHMYPLAKHNLKRLFHHLPDYCCQEHSQRKSRDPYEKLKVEISRNEFEAGPNDTLSQFPSYISGCSSQPLEEESDCHYAPKRSFLEQPVSE